MLKRVCRITTQTHWRSPRPRIRVRQSIRIHQPERRFCYPAAVPFRSALLRRISVGRHSGSKSDQVKRVGWIDKAGQWVVTEVQGRLSAGEFSKTFSSFNVDCRYSEGLATFTVYSAQGMDRKGKVAIEPAQFNKVGPFVRIAQIYVRGDEGSSDDYGYINKTGQFIWRSK